ncbi:hypothetical protein OIU78_023356 [Salix suchowensis]|nr:hypothetical protein OIU78_023356 [Salix suchowensis]
MNLLLLFIIKCHKHFPLLMSTVFKQIQLSRLSHHRKLLMFFAENFRRRANQLHYYFQQMPGTLGICYSSTKSLSHQYPPQSHC